jgi:hypothetical protein
MAIRPGNLTGISNPSFSPGSSGKPAGGLPGGEVQTLKRKWIHQPAAHNGEQNERSKKIEKVFDAIFHAVFGDKSEDDRRQNAEDEHQ